MPCRFIKNSVGSRSESIRRTMLIRYLPGKYDERISVPVQKKVISCNRKENNGGWLIFEITGGKRQEVKLEECKPLMSRVNKVRSCLKLGGLFVLLIAFCSGICNIISRIYNDGQISSGIVIIFQLLTSLLLLAYLTCIFKMNIERYLFGGLSFSRGEIYFQSDNEKALFYDVLKK